MQAERKYYLLQIQYLGFRYHGWQKQPGVKTVEEMLSRTVAYVLDHHEFKLLASGRTDAMVSAAHALVELFLNKGSLADDFFDLLNSNLPPDIRLIDLDEVNADFNVIDAPVQKTYLYLFAHGQKIHPFAAPLMAQINEELDVAIMEQAARFFEGNHNLINYIYKPKSNTHTQVEIKSCQIQPNTFYSASFFPPESFALVVKGKGFKRHQIRLIMGALIDLGLGNYNLDFIRNSITGEKRIHLDRIAPASGLILQSISFADG